MVTLELVLQVFPILSLSVALVYYAINVRNQNRTTQASMFMQMHNQYLSISKEVHVFYLFRNATFSTAEEFIELITNDSEWTKVNDIWLQFLEGLGVVVKAGFLDIKMVALMWSGLTRITWDKLEPIMDDFRRITNFPRLYSETEYLCKELIKYVDAHPELKT